MRAKKICILGITALLYLAVGAQSVGAVIDTGDATSHESFVNDTGDVISHDMSYSYKFELRANSVEAEVNVKGSEAGAKGVLNYMYCGIGFAGVRSETVEYDDENSDTTFSVEADSLSTVRDCQYVSACFTLDMKKTSYNSEILSLFDSAKK